MKPKKASRKLKAEWETIFSALEELRLSSAAESWAIQDMTSLLAVHKIVKSFFDETWRIPG